MSDAQALVEDLTRPWRHGEHVDARGLVLEAPLVLDGFEIRGFDLSKVVLKGGLSARGTQFRGLAWLRGAQIQGDCDFFGAQFRTDLRADGLKACRVDLEACHLQGVLSLSGAELKALSLRNALVMANTTLESAKIGEVDLDDAELLGGLWTSGAQMQGFQPKSAEISGRLAYPDRFHGPH